LPPEPQLRPQPPQFAVSLVGSTHAAGPPPPPPPPHVMSPVGQLQTPLTHVAPVAHRRPHAPQLFTSDARIAHPPPGQATAPVPHVQTPLVHVPPAQFFPQPPQLAVSVEGSTHLPVQAICGDVQTIDVSVAPSVGGISVSVGAPSGRTEVSTGAPSGSTEVSPPVPPVSSVDESVLSPAPASSEPPHPTFAASPAHRQRIQARLVPAM
jgi:hypothetical protein